MTTATLEGHTKTIWYYKDLEGRFFKVCIRHVSKRGQIENYGNPIRGYLNFC